MLLENFAATYVCGQQHTKIWSWQAGWYFFMFYPIPLTWVPIWQPSASFSFFEPWLLLWIRMLRGLGLSKGGFYRPFDSKKIWKSHDPLWPWTLLRTAYKLSATKIDHSHWSNGHSTHLWLADKRQTNLEALLALVNLKANSVGKYCQLYVHRLQKYLFH